MVVSQELSVSVEEHFSQLQWKMTKTVDMLLLQVWLQTLKGFLIIIYKWKCKVSVLYSHQPH